MQEAPLEAFAPPVRPLVTAFRDAGRISFQDRGVLGAREAYRTSCAANGLPTQQLAVVEDRTVAGRSGPVRVRYYRPVADRGVLLPCVLFFHGGGWVIGDLDTHDGMCRFLATATGAVVVAVDYRLSPEHAFPAAPHDCIDALAAVWADSRALGIDRTRLAVAGDSAGGNLAAVVALASRAPDLPDVGAQLLLYPVTDVSQESGSYGRVESGVPLTAATMRWFRQAYLPREAVEPDWWASPARCPDLSGSAPAFLVTVGHDPLCDEGIAYAGRLAMAGTRVVHHHLPGYVHGLFTSAGVLDAGRDLLREAAVFLVHTWSPEGAS